VVRRRRLESITLGRDPESTITIEDATVSRRHCVIERRQHNFVVRDHSANGTFILPAGGAAQIVLRREEFVLQGHGWLTLGRPKSTAAHAVEYFCEDEATSGRK
jgi:adenylate cyclase